MPVLSGFVLLGSFLSSLCVVILLSVWYLAVGLTWKQNESLWNEWKHFLIENNLKWNSLYGLGSIIYCAIARNQKLIYTKSHAELEIARRVYQEYHEMYQRTLKDATNNDSNNNNIAKGEKQSSSIDNHNSSISPTAMISTKKKPSSLITFAGAGTLWAHYLGIIACYRDVGFITERKLNDGSIRVAGISCGCSAAVVIYFNLTMIQAFKFGLMWQSVFDSRLLKFWFLSAHLIESNIQRMFAEECGINDEVLHRLQGIRGKDALTFGITTLFQPSIGISHSTIINSDDETNIKDESDSSEDEELVPPLPPPYLHRGKRTDSDSMLQSLQSLVFPTDNNNNYRRPNARSQSAPSLFHRTNPKMQSRQRSKNKRQMVSFECIDSFVSVEEMVKGAVCSMRTVPFFRSLGKFRGKYCCDGGLSSFYAIPPSVDSSSILRVSPIDPALLMRENVESSAIYPSHMYQLHEFVDSGTFSDNLKRFIIGYQTAANVMSIRKCLNQGLEFDHNSGIHDTFNDHQKWESFVSSRVQYWTDHLNTEFNPQ